MKISSFILCMILLSCGNQQEENLQNILSENSFINILKDIHLAEAFFELNKTKSIENAKKELAKNYVDIYKKNKISEDYFNKSLDFYSKKPELLEQIYSNIILQLTNERSKIDQQ